MNLTNWNNPPIEGVLNLSSVDRFYFAGKIEDISAVETLVGLGVTTFIDLKRPEEARGSKNDCLWVRNSNANYFNLPVSDPREDIDFAFHEKMRAIIESAQGKILIYCMSSNRVGYWFGRYLCEVVGLPKKKCLDYAIKAGLGESTVPKFKDHLGSH